MSNTARRQVSTGQIVSLMSTEAENFHMCMNVLHTALIAPLMFIAYMIFGAITNGFSIISGLLVSLILLVLRFLAGRAIGRLRHLQEGWTSKRVNLMSEIISAMKVIKMYSWEKPFSKQAQKLRKSETDANLKRSMLILSGMTTSYHITTYVAFSMLLTSYLLGYEISPEVTVRLIGWLRVMLISAYLVFPLSYGVVFETIGATEKIKIFLMSDDFVPDSSQTTDNTMTTSVNLCNVTAYWDDNDNGKVEKIADPTLASINFSSKSGELIGLTGKVGSSKSSLLMAILGELALSQGERHVHGQLAFVPQESWIISDTIRSNIIMDAEFDQEWYETVLEACTLDVDINVFPLADMTLVGERGLSLSGGQKARLNLARAIYQDADIYLLDNPLAAVDGRVGNHIFNRCIRRLLKSKLCILVTHNMQYLRYVDRIVIMDKGKIIISGKWCDLSSQLSDVVEKNQTKDSSRRSIRESIQYEPANNVLMRKMLVAQRAEENYICAKFGADLYADSRLTVEKNRGIPNTVFLSYFKDGKGKVFIPLIILLLGLSEIAEVSSGWILSQWSTETTHAGSNHSLSLSQAPEHSSVWFITVLTILAIATLVSGQLLGAMISLFLTTANQTLYNKMFDVVLRAPMYFFETNPVGQVLNRFSRDAGFIDIFFILHVYLTCQIMGSSAAVMVFACIIYPWMMVVTILFLVITITFMYFVMNGVQEVKRMENSFRSPMFSHLSATLQGLSVIRAFRKQNYFLADAFAYMDRHTAAWHTYLCVQRYIGIHIDFFASVLVVSYILVTVLTATPGTDNAQAGASGLAFVYLLYLLGSFQYGFQQVAETLTIMTSVERIQQFARLEQEAPEHTDVVPPNGWPNEGHIRLKEMCVTYKGQSHPALGPITLNILPAEKVGIVGRTGAGKSSLFVSLLRMVEPSGSIQIDGVEITQIGLTDLRTNISVIPQDPVLFSGSLRFNLDPFEEFPDDHVWEALQHVQLHTKVSALSGGLSAEMGEAGDNFSVGEKQLLCMARALMRKNKIIIVDEATANVDYSTDGIIQETLTREFADSTVLTIAHRLHTIITYDKIMVLERGRLVEFDHPYTLLQDSSSMFHQMVQHLRQVSREKLHEDAKTSFLKTRHLVETEYARKTDLSTQLDGGAYANMAFVQ